MNRQRERGQSLFEMASGLTVLLVLLAGLVDLGRAFFARVALLDAAEEGALYASYEPTDVYGIEGRIRDQSDGPVDFSDPSSVQISVEYPDKGKACAGYTLRVVLDHEVTIITPFLGAILGTQTFPLSVSSESLILSPECP
jgi:hypothetical protein